MENKSRDVIFARGLLWPDASQVAGVIAKAIDPIVLVPDQIPDDHFWIKKMPPVVALSQVSQLGEGRIEICDPELLGIVTNHNETLQEAASQIIDEKKLKLYVRQQVKADKKTELTDDICLAAYRQQGSFRKAAKYLTKESGQSVSKDRINRVVQRKGGIDAVKSGTNSASVQRSASAQHHDGKKKIQDRSDATDWAIPRETE